MQTDRRTYFLSPAWHLCDNDRYNNSNNDNHHIQPTTNHLFAITLVSFFTDTYQPPLSHICCEQHMYVIPTKTNIHTIGQVPPCHSPNRKHTNHLFIFRNNNGSKCNTGQQLLRGSCLYYSYYDDEQKPKSYNTNFRLIILLSRKSIPTQHLVKNKKL